MPPRQQQEDGGPGTQFVVFADYSGGMDTQSAREGLPENKAAWIENLQPVAPNFLLGVPSPVAALATLTGESVVKVFPGLIGTQDYIVAFCASGAGYTITVNGNGNGVPATGGLVVKFAPAFSFSATGPDMTVLNAQRFLFADSVAGYASYDGSVFVKQGTVSPNFAITAGGSGYTSGATATITGGSGSGATLTVQITGGVVTGLTLTNAGSGYKAGDTLTVTISPAGAGSGATANAHIWPFVSPAPTTLAIAFGRVWLASGRTLLATGIGSATFGGGFDDFSPADGAVSTTISDTDLVHFITALRFLENFLYIIGDNSVKAIGSITIASSVTSFTITTLSSDQGTIYPQSIISFDRLVTLTNTVGVFAVFGTSVQKVSDPMDGILRGCDFTLLPQAAVNDINNIHTLLVLVRYKDPVNGSRSILMAFANKRWFLVAQGGAVQAITSVVLGGITETFTSSGSDITQILQGTSPLAWKVMTALTTAQNPVRDKRVVRAGVAQTASTTSDLMLTVDTESASVNANLANETGPILQFVNNAGLDLLFQNNLGQELDFVTQGFILSHSANFSATGRYIGGTATGTLNGEALQAIILEYADAAIWGKG